MATNATIFVFIESDGVIVIFSAGQHRYSAEIIVICVWLYHRFPLSFREVEELMLVRCDDSHRRDDPAVVRRVLMLQGRPACAAANPDPATSGISTRCPSTINGRRQHPVAVIIDQYGNVLDILQSDLAGMPRPPSGSSPSR